MVGKQVFYGIILTVKYLRFNRYFCMQMTWADILVGDYLCEENVARWSKVLNVENQFPSLAKLVDKVNSIPKIKDWMEKRQKTNV